MPISECDGLGPRHWADVLSIISSAAESAGFNARLVSDTDGSNLIHKEILHNIYHDDIVICDVSGRNPNVFFELGIRMATRKPTVIVKDRDTAYPFDTGPNRYVEYPRDLRHPEMEVFKRKLKDALEKTMDHSPEQSFIGQLGPFKVLDVETTASSSEEVILERLDQIERAVQYQAMTKEKGPKEKHRFADPVDGPKALMMMIINKNELWIRYRGWSETEAQNAVEDLMSRAQYHQKLLVRVRAEAPNKGTVRFSGEIEDPEALEAELRQCLDNAIPF